MTEQLFALLLFLFPLAYSPGPGNLFFAANGARFGAAATVPASAGYHAATWAVTVAIGAGFAAALEQAPGLFAALRWIGGGYVLYIAWKFLRANAPHTAAARPAGFLDGAALLVLNPKAHVIIALMFTQFLPADGQDRLKTVLWIATVFTLNNLLAFTVWTLAGDRIGAGLRDAARARALNTTFAGCLAAVALWMLFA